MARRGQQNWNPLLKTYPESQRVNRLSLGGEVLYARLLAASDDNANYYGDPALLASYLFGHRLANRTASVPKVSRWRDEIVSVGLAKLYEIEGIAYIHLIDCFKLIRSDVIRKVSFPEFTQPLVPQHVPENVPEPGQVRDESGTDSMAQTHTHTQTHIQNKTQTQKKKTPLAESAEKHRASPQPIPAELKGLSLYETDEKLCKAWPEVYPTWGKTYPGVDLMAEVKKAHAWELANPERRKKLRVRFLNSWLTRAQDRVGGKRQETGEWNFR